MASSSSLESIIKSEQFPCRRVAKQSIPTVIVTNETNNSSNNIDNAPDSNGVSKSPATGQQGTSTPSVTKQSDVANKFKYGRVVIALENPILPDESIQNTPSMADGLDRESENDLRITGCKLIQISGVLLRLPQVCIWFALIYLLEFTNPRIFSIFRLQWPPVRFYFIVIIIQNHLSAFQWKSPLWPVSFSLPRSKKHLAEYVILSMFFTIWNKSDYNSKCWLLLLASSINSRSYHSYYKITFSHIYCKTKHHL